MIDASKVQNLFLDCLFTDEEAIGCSEEKPPENAVIVEGVVGKFAFHKERLESHRQEVKDFLSQLPDNFIIGKGGGWSFLNACEDRDGNQWGEHRNIEQLMCLGIGLGMVTYCLPRPLWQLLPGQVPYFSVTL